MPSYDVTRRAAEMRARRAALRLRGVRGRATDDERLVEAVADAQHTAMVEAGRARDPFPNAARWGHPRPPRDEAGRPAAEPTARVYVADLRATLIECDVLRAESTRLLAEAEHADELLAEYEARTALADELVRLIQRIGVLEDGTDDDRRAAIPLHGRVAELCGEYDTTYLGGPEVRDGE